MDRRWLRGNRSTAIPRHIVCFDTETTPEAIAFKRGAKGRFIFQNEADYFSARGTEVFADLHKMRLGVAASFDWFPDRIENFRTLHFTDADVFWSWTVDRGSPREPVWVFAHNVGFDLTVTGFWERLEAGEFTFGEKKHSTDKRDSPGKKRTRQPGFLCIDDPPVILSVHSRRGRHLMILDTINWFKQSLDSLGKRCGVRKTKMPEFADSDEIWFRYCEQDVKILVQVVRDLCDTIHNNDLGQFRWSAPAQAFAAFRHRFYPVKIEMHDEEPVRALERQSYFGGRVECFKLGKFRSPLWQLDVASMYPSVMRANKYPHRLLYHWLDSPDRKPDVAGLRLNHIAEVEIESSHESFPFRQENQTIFALGKYTTTLAGPELIRARDAGAIVSIGRWSQYALAPLFREFVDYFWDERLKAKAVGDEVWQQFCKLMMNYLYGKFGQAKSSWEDLGLDRDTTAWTEWCTVSTVTGETNTFRTIGHHTQKLLGLREHPNAFPAIAAFVTAYGREALLRLMKLAGLSNVYYCSTDCLITNEDGFRALESAGEIEPGTLGKLVIEAAGRTGEIRSVHQYRVGRKSRFGSRKKSATLNPDGSISETQFQSLGSIVKQPPQGGVLVWNRSRTFSCGYTRGAVDAKTGIVSPYVLDGQTSCSDWDAGNAGYPASTSEVSEAQPAKSPLTPTL